jgi:phage/plasmid-like protein (TIGR03299 family)
VPSVALRSTQTGGRVRAFFAGKPAWHGLGVNVDRACSSAQAIQFAGLDWSVVKVPMGFEHNGQRVMTRDTFAIVRADNGAHLGTVGSRYAPIQNADGFGYLDNVLSSVGAKYETAGSLYGGSKVWMLAHLPEQRFSIAGEDACEPYVVFMNTHDGSGAAACYPTSVRVECNNTLRISAKDKAKGISIRHTGSVKDKVKAAQKALGMAIDGFQAFKDNAEMMARTECDPMPYFDGVLDSVLDITRAEMSKGADALAAVIAVTHAEREAARKLAEHKIKTRREIFDDMVTRYESERCANGRGSLWSAFNAVTESADHGLAGGKLRGDDKQSRRFESVISGRADEIKQVAYVQALSRA